MSGPRYSQQPQTTPKMTNYNHFVIANRKMVQKLVDFSGVKEDLVRKLIRFTKCLAKPENNRIDKKIFTAVMYKYFEMSDPVFIRTTYDKLSKNSVESQITVEDFARVLCIYFTDRLDLKIDFVFSMFDHNADGEISMVELVGFVKSCKCLTDVDDADRDDTMADLTMMASELLGITPEEPCTQEMFRAKAKENSLILSVLGHCLPERDAGNRFKAKIATKSTHEIMKVFGNIRQDLLQNLDASSSRHNYYPITLDLP